MKTGVLFSGGKDSCLAIQKAMEKEEVVCLITVVSENPESYMFHTPNIGLTALQAEAAGLPLLSIVTPGEKERELEELERVLKKAKELFGIDGAVTGAIASSYQKERIENICSKLGIESINPLWGVNQTEVLREIVESGFDVMITGVFAEPLGREWLGRIIDMETIRELEELWEKHGINPSGEGGEIETTVLDAPFFKKKVEIKETSLHFSNYSGILNIEKAVLKEK